MHTIEEMGPHQLLDEKRALEEAIARLELSMTRAANWIISQFAPNGPIMREPRLSLCHKSTWGLFEDGRLEEANRLLDWIDANAKLGVGRYGFARETPFENEQQLLYRLLTFGKVAEDLRHPAFANDETRQEILTYQHPCGGVVGYKEDPAYVQTLNPLFTGFFGIWALKAGLVEPAVKAAEFLIHMCELNKPHMDGEPGRFYFTYDPATDSLNTDFEEGQSVNYVFDTTSQKGHFYHLGVVVALLADVYKATGDQQLLNVAEELCLFERRLNPVALKWPSYCKIAWGAGELYGLTGKPEHRIAAMNVCDITFIAAQEASGAWSRMFYPLRDDGAWQSVDYDGTDAVPVTLPDDGSWEMLEPQDISGEFLGETGRAKKAFKHVLGEIDRRLTAHGLPVG
jgi:hypothetical protein